MLITQTQFNQVFPKAHTGIYPAIAKHIGKIAQTREQEAMFLAQCGHETAGFTAFVENLNYSETALLRTFPRHFTPEQAKAYARKPEKIANRAYANRMGNGAESTGDGWKYRGRGLIQLTGRANYIAFERWLKRDIQADDVGTDFELIVLAGIWYWQNRRLNEYVSVSTVTKLINGGVHGLMDRDRLYHRLLDAKN